MFSKLINRLTSNYDKDENSNIAKLYKIYASELEQIKNTLEKIKLYQDIDNATDRTLDRMGNNALEPRSTEDDEIYREFIKTKIIANLSKGDIETINQVATVLLGKSFRGVTETWNQEKYNNEPAGLALVLRNHSKDLPFEAIDRTVAGGVGLRWILELKQDVPEIFIGIATLSGEEITVYPYSPTSIESKGKVYIATGNDTTVENMTVYPKKEKEVI